MTPTLELQQLIVTRPEPDADYTDRLQELLQAGADVNAVDAEGFTPLLRCLSWRWGIGEKPLFEYEQKALSILLRAGADLDACTPSGVSVDGLVQFWPDSGVAELKIARERFRRADPVLMQAYDIIPHTWPIPSDPCHDAALPEHFVKLCESGDAAQVGYILHIRPDAIGFVADISSEGARNGVLSALHRGLSQTHVLELLFAQGADVEWRDAQGWSALALAADHVDAAKVLPVVLAQKPALDRPDPNGKTPLRAALHNCDAAAVALLLAAGADPLALGPAGLSVLQEAEELARLHPHEGLDDACRHLQKAATAQAERTAAKRQTLLADAARASGLKFKL